MRSFHRVITRRHRGALAFAALLIGRARARIFFAHATFRAQCRHRSAPLLRDVALACKVWHT